MGFAPDRLPAMETLFEEVWLMDLSDEYFDAADFRKPADLDCFAPEPARGFYEAERTYRRLQILQSNQRSIWISGASAHPCGIRKVRNLRAELPSQINDLEFRTESAKSGALERMGRRETKTAVWRVSEVGSF